MVHGNALIEFGKGSTAMLPFAWSNGVGGLSMWASEPGELGRYVPLPEDWEPDDSDVLITFDNPESVMNFIKNLQDVHKFMLQAREETVMDEKEDPGSITREYHENGNFTEYKED